MKPIARHDVIIEALGDELLVYDTRTDTAHALDGAAHAVWRLADGTRDAAAIAAEAGLEPAAVEHALALLEERDLVRATGLSRRRLLQVTGVAAIALPVVRSIAAPTAAAAATCGTSGSSCTIGAQCCSTVCSSGICA